MILQDSEILRRLHEDPNFDIKPIDVENQIQPATVDMRLGDTFLEFRQDPTRSHIDPVEDTDEYVEEVQIEDGAYILNPGEFILGHTLERYTMPPDLVGIVHGRSSWARLAVVPHLGGLIDPGYEGKITLEMANLGHMPIKLYPGMRFCQMTYHQTIGPSDNPYDGKYQGDNSVARSRLSEE